MLPKCDRCYMRISSYMTKHQKTTTCQAGARRRMNETKQDMQAKGNDIRFYVNGKEIERVRSFKYLGWIFVRNG